MSPLSSCVVRHHTRCSNLAKLYRVKNRKPPRLCDYTSVSFNILKVAWSGKSLIDVSVSLKQDDILQGWRMVNFESSLI